MDYKKKLTIQYSNFNNISPKFLLIGNPDHPAMQHHILTLLRLFIVLAFLSVFSSLPLHADSINKRVLLIDSYHKGYSWSDGIIRGVHEVLLDANVEFEIHRMDTKRNRSKDFILQAAKIAKDKIKSFAPDVVIICDDNAVKHVLQSFYKNVDLPFVFCGVNWDASIYGLPYSNTTGMVEVDLIKPLVRQLRPIAKGERLGYLALDSVSSHKNLKGHQSSNGINYHKIYMVESYEEWKQKYIAMQNEVDMLILGNHVGLKEWNESALPHFIRQNTRIPSGSLAPGRMEFSLLGYLRFPEEHGRWAAQNALKILNGTKPVEIPITHNQEGRVVINHYLSEKLGITFPPALFKRAEIFRPYNKKKILYISSYNLTVHWSRGIHNSMLKELNRTGVEYKEFFMGAKRNRSDDHLTKKAQEAKQLIETFSPDVVITSDDAAVKYVVTPHYKDSKLPFVFCGLNWDASIYGLPTANVTGMVEVELIVPLIKQLRRYAKGPRLGWLSENSMTQKRNVVYHQKLFGIKYDKIYMVNSYDDWKTAFLRLQDEVDMLVVQAPHAVSGWNKEEEHALTEKHLKILTGALTVNQTPFTVMGYVRLPEEQGEWVAETALRILDGTLPKDIPVVQNKQGKLILNRRLLKKLGVVVDRALYRMGEIIE